MTAGKSDQNKPLVFVSYAREDNKPQGNKKGWLDRLLLFLKRPLEQAGIELFIDNTIITGEYSPVIKSALERATAALLLISPAFMDSDYIIDRELPVIISRYKTGRLDIFPVLISCCTWDLVRIVYPGQARDNLSNGFLLSHLLLPGHDPDHPLDELPDSTVNKVFKEVTHRILSYHAHIKKQEKAAAQNAKKRKSVNEADDTEGMKAQKTGEQKTLPLSPGDAKNTTIVPESSLPESTTIVPESTQPVNTTIVDDPSTTTTIVPGSTLPKNTTIVVPKPTWATAAGKDNYGTWADFTINGVTQRMRRIKPGEFLMGSPQEELDRDKDEFQHRVVITKGFWLADTTCTQALWQVVMGDNPSGFKGNNLPVDNVSWKMADKFIKKCNHLVPGIDLRLPTEAEWEYACRAGTVTPFSFGQTITTKEVNYDGNYPYGKGKKGLYRGKTVDVISLPCNPWGLYQMHGNVWEWCADWYAKDYYQHSPKDDPPGPETGTGRVLRGGCWDADGQLVRSAYRSRSEPGFRYWLYGFRLARGAPSMGNT